MDRTGRIFLETACLSGARWADKFETLADAWDNCSRVRWMLWALAELEITVSNSEHGARNADVLRSLIGNPWRTDKRRRCLYCVLPNPLTEEEERDSQLVGTQPRCAEHLREVGLPQLTELIGAST